MRKYLSHTQPDCYRSREVMHRIRQHRLREDRVAVVSRDHPDTMPDGLVHRRVLSPESAFILERPVLCVIDNLRFCDARGLEFECWDDHAGTWQTLHRARLEWVFDQLGEVGTEEIILVAEDDVISVAWQSWLNAQNVGALPRTTDSPAVRRRSWSLSDSEGTRYRYRDRRLIHRGHPRCPRRFEAEVHTPQAEALLAIVAEFVCLQHECPDPDDPDRRNRPPDRIDEIVRAFSVDRSPVELLNNLEDLHDLLTVHVDVPFGEVPGSVEN